MTEETETGVESAEPKQNDRESAGIDFLDFLFTFVLTFGLAPEALGIEGTEGLLSEGWFSSGHDWTIADADKITALFFGLLTLTLSWFGYHASIRRQPLDLEKLSGLARFQIDVLLVLIYGLILIKYRNFDLIVVCSLLIFGLFVVWDFFKAKEMGNPYLRPLDPSGKLRPNYRRELVTVGWTIAIFLDMIIYFFALHSMLVWSIIAIAISVVYRVHKIKPWRSLEKRLGVQTWEALKKST